MQYLKTLFYKFYFSIALLTDDNIDLSDRIWKFLLAILTFGPIAFILDKAGSWFTTHQGFVIGVVGVILINIILGGLVHNRKKDFDWKTLLYKTNEMVIILLASYLTLEILMSVAGDNPVITAFRITIQVTTLLYPGSKILKNIFILSKGEYPPKWLMTKVYNFQENGDLNALLKTNKDENKD